MTPARCSCGFTELPDESITDHLLRLFTPEDNRGNDGFLHEESRNLACACGLTTAASGALDEHFLEVFRPADRIGRDGDAHEAAPA